MPDAPKESWQRGAWNVLADQWLEAMDLDAETQVYSPLEALEQASVIRCISAASPLDLFAAHRFLLTLLYWKADAAGGVQRVRESLLRGKTPRVVHDAIKAEASRFDLFDVKAPLLQDPSARDSGGKSAGSLFAEFASGTNIAHFHHGDDKSMRLCLRCASAGMLRLVPWSQSGGRGLTPSVHNAPPIMALARGSDLATTLGLNLVPLSCDPGEAKWTGRFEPSDRDAAIPYLEALTWNPRRVHLLSTEIADFCWRCGQPAVVAVGPIAYLKNEETKTKKEKGNKTIPFAWQDPSAFYAADAPFVTMKSRDEETAASGRDLARLLQEKEAPTSVVVAANPEHQGWHLVIPCTNPAYIKTFDHRQLDLRSLSPDAIHSKLPSDVPATGTEGFDGWAEPRRPDRAAGAARFVRGAARLLTDTDWAALSAAAFQDMSHSPAAFDVLSGLLWPLRRRKIAGLPSRNAAWLVLKLMAAVPSRARVSRPDASFCPIGDLPRRQPDELRRGTSRRSPYPVSFPRGRRLEAALRSELDKNMRKRNPERIDWTGLCHGLDRLLD